MAPGAAPASPATARFGRKLLAAGPPGRPGGVETLHGPAGKRSSPQGAALRRLQPPPPPLRWRAAAAPCMQQAAGGVPTCGCCRALPDNPCYLQVHCGGICSAGRTRGPSNAAAPPPPRARPSCPRPPPSRPPLSPMSCACTLLLHPRSTSFATLSSRGHAATLHPAHCAPPPFPGLLAPRTDRRLPLAPPAHPPTPRPPAGPPPPGSRTEERCRHGLGAGRPAGPLPAAPHQQQRQQSTWAAERALRRRRRQRAGARCPRAAHSAPLPPAFVQAASLE